MMSHLNPAVGPADHVQGRRDAVVTLVEYGDFSGGVRSGVNGTPCLFVDGERWEGAATAEALLPTLLRLAGG
jgi:hypothetical protein